MRPLPNTSAPLWFSEDGRQLITLNRDHTFSLWDVLSETEVRRLGPQTTAKAFTAKAVSGDGKTLALGYDNGAVELWDLETDKRKYARQPDGQRIWALLFSQGGLVVWASESAVGLYDLSTHRERHQFPQLAAPVALTPDGLILAARAAGHRIKMIEVSSGRELAAVPGHEADINAIAFGPDGKLLATSQADGTIRLWEVPRGRDHGILARHLVWTSAVVFSPDGNTVVTISADNEIKWWNWATRQELMRVDRSNSSALSSFALFSPTGNVLALIADENRAQHGYVELWRAPSFEEIDLAEAKKRAAP